MTEEPKESGEPMTQTVLTPQDFQFQSHNWSQVGYSIECDGLCGFGHRHGHYIPSGKMLVGKKGAWELVDE